ncbi:histidine kinase [Hymenobacter koreensis]|uniref:Histidine kinase n=1 Tax=Hymenobacter koreensis TaxID=1084523 RepID=A0ABP8IXR7_9BACT
MHVLWVVVLIGTDAVQLFSWHNGQNGLAPWTQLVPRMLMNDALASLVFYINWAVLIPRTLARSRVLAYVLGVCGLLLVFVPLRMGSSYVTRSTTEPQSEQSKAERNWAMFSVPYTIFGLMTIFLSSGFKVTGDYMREQRNRRELERQQLLTELSLLKMQVNPHFLFNTLNNIYSLASQKSDRAPEAVLRLAEIMRYMLYESNADTVPLTKEVAHLRSFLDLQRLRLPGNAPEAIVFDTTGVPPDTSYAIAPMLLMPLVENAFKHGDLSARPAVVIRLQVMPDNQLHFSVRNHVAPEDSRLLGQPGGVGLTNLRRRLELLYPKRYVLAVTSPEGQHQVDLTLREA